MPPRLCTDGAEVLYDYAESGEDEEAARAARELVVARSDQRVFNEVVDAYPRDDPSRSSLCGCHPDPQVDKAALYGGLYTYDDQDWSLGDVAGPHHP